MILSFRCAETKRLWFTLESRHPPDIQRRALKKLMLLDTAQNLQDLRVPPGNHLEALLGDRQSQYSIRINKRWRICFIWRDGNAWDVEIVDYH